MSGRHKMPRTGRRKAATVSAPNIEEPTPGEVVPEQAEPEDTAAEPAIDEPAGTDEPESTEDTDEPVDAEGDEEDADAEAPADTEESDEPAAEPEVPARSRINPLIVVAGLALVLVAGSAVVRWQTVNLQESAAARTESVEAATDIVGEMLSYEPGTVAEQLTAARERMTGEFRDTYTAQTDVIIPTAQAQQIAAMAEVLRVGTEAVHPDSADLILYVNQIVSVPGQMPDRTSSVVRATVVKRDDRWLLSTYEPVVP